MKTYKVPFHNPDAAYYEGQRAKGIEARRRILELMADRQTRTIRQIADALGRGDEATAAHVRRLHEKGHLVIVVPMKILGGHLGRTPAVYGLPPTAGAAPPSPDPSSASDG